MNVVNNYKHINEINPNLMIHLLAPHLTRNPDVDAAHIQNVSSWHLLAVQPRDHMFSINPPDQKADDDHNNFHMLLIGSGFRGQMGNLKWGN